MVAIGDIDVPITIWFNSVQKQLSLFSIVATPAFQAHPVATELHSYRCPDLWRMFARPSLLPVFAVAFLAHALLENNFQCIGQ